MKSVWALIGPHSGRAQDTEDHNWFDLNSIIRQGHGHNNRSMSNSCACTVKDIETGHLVLNIETCFLHWRKRLDVIDSYTEHSCILPLIMYS